MGPQQQLGKINQPGALAGLLVTAVNLDHPFQYGIAVQVDVLRPQAVILLPIDKPLRLPGGVLVFIQVQAPDNPPQGAQLVITVQDLKTVGQACFLPVQA